jgi:hypothetical protein
MSKRQHYPQIAQMDADENLRNNNLRKSASSTDITGGLA